MTLRLFSSWHFYPCHIFWYALSTILKYFNVRRVLVCYCRWEISIFIPLFSLSDGRLEFSSRWKSLKFLWIRERTMKSSLVLESIWQKWWNLTLSMDGSEMKQKLMYIVLPLTETFYTEGLCINTLSEITNLKLDLMNGVSSKMDWISFDRKTLSTVLLVDRYESAFNQIYIPFK